MTSATIEKHEAEKDEDCVYLTERAYLLLERLANLHCLVNKTTWVIGIVHRANAWRYIRELTSHALVGMNPQKHYFITAKGRDYLRKHPRRDR